MQTNFIQREDRQGRAFARYDGEDFCLRCAPDGAQPIPRHEEGIPGSERAARCMRCGAVREP